MTTGCAGGRAVSSAPARNPAEPGAPAGAAVPGATPPGETPGAGGDLRFELEGSFPSGVPDEERLRSPQGVSVDFSGHVFVAEAGGNRVAVFTPTGEFLKAFGSPGTGEGRFQVPAGICAARSFSLFVADSEQDRVQVFDHAGSFAGWMPAEEGVLQRPWGVDLGPDGRLYIADRDNHRVVVVSESGEIVDTLGSLGGGAAQLREPTWVAVSESGIVVSDTGNRRLQRFDLNGSYAGEVTGAAIPGGFGSPAGIDLDKEGAIFVADSTARKVVALDDHGAFLGEAGLGAGDPEGPEVPSGLALGPDGRLYVADARGGRVFIYRVRKDGRIPPSR